MKAWSDTEDMLLSRRRFFRQAGVLAGAVTLGTQGAGAMSGGQYSAYCASRDASSRAFRNWAISRWKRFQRHGPLAVQPLRRGYADAYTNRECRDLFAGLYLSDRFGDLTEFCLWDNYVTSMQQAILRDDEPSLAWFVPETLSEGVGRAAREWDAGPQVLRGNEVQQWLEGWKLPPSIAWLAELHHVEARLDESETATVLRSRTREGFVIFLAVGSWCDPTGTLPRVYVDRLPATRVTRIR